MLLSPNPLAHRGVLFLLTVCVVSAALAGIYKFLTASASTSRETTVARPAIETSAPAPVSSTIVVNSTSDVENNSDGLCTLREAITAANTDTASGLTAGECVAGSASDTIDLTGVSGTITLTSALPAIATDMTLTGPSASQLTVSGNNSVRVFYITLSGPGIVNFSGLTISNGLATMDVGGGIYNQNTATVNVSDSTISNNSAVLGGGLANSSTGPFTITNCILTGNSAGTAGGIYNGLGPFNVINSTLSNNTTGGIGSGNGGGIGTGSGTLTVVNSTFDNNGAAGAGGAIHKNGSGSITVTNSTLTNNSASGGGGIANQSGNPPQVRNTIIALNSSVSGPDVFGSFTSQGHNLIGKNDGSSGFTAGTSNPNGDLVGTVATPINPMLAALANNGGPTQTRALIQGSIAIDAGDNCVLTNSCVPALASAITNDQRGTGFGRSVDGNGDGNATVDIGAYEFRGILVTNTNDSGTGSLRQAIIDANTNSDSSAINFQPGLTGTISLSTALPVLSTSMAINGPGADVLTVQRSTDGGTPNFRIFATNSTVIISGLTLSNGRTADGAPGFGAGGGAGGNGGGILNSGTLTLTDIVVTANRTGDGGADFNFNGGPGGYGGGIYSTGSLTMTNVTVSNNTAGNTGAGKFGSGGGRGGGLYFAGSALNMNNCVVSGNTAGNAIPGTSGAGGGGGGGGGINIAAGTANLTNVTITGNNAGNASANGSGGDGGGIYNSGTLTTLINSTVSNNGTGEGGMSGGSGGLGGGIFNVSPMNVIGSTVNSNFTRAPSAGPLPHNAGGGIYNNSHLTMANSTISGNQAHADQARGGGIFNNGEGPGVLTLQNCTITANSAVTCCASQSGQGIHNGGTASVANTIIAGNGVASVPDVTGNFTSRGNNIIGKATLGGSGGINGDESGFTNGTNNDQVGTIASPIDARLATLANNGGSTLTHPLLPGSPALDGGNNCVTEPAHCGDPNVPQLTTDQRGFNRVVNSTVDIGAFESRGFTISATSGTPQSTVIGSTFSSPFVATVSSSFAEPVAGGVITFSAPVLGASGTFPGSVTSITASTNGSGVATSPAFTANLIAGSYNVTAGANGISSPASFSLTNSQAATSTSVSSSVNPSDFGESVTFTATISTSVNVTPTGIVQFKDGVTDLGSPVNCVGASGNTCTAQFSTSTLSVGNHNISATYSGDTNVDTSTGSLAGSQVVNCVSIIVSNTNDSGPGSLRQAILGACPDSTITFAAGLTSGGPATITLAIGELVIDKNLTIRGPGANLLSVSGNNSSRVFNVQAGTVLISALAIINGQVTNAVGGAGGGVINRGALTLINCAITNNTAGNSGGGLANFADNVPATLTIINSTINGNRASSFGSGLHNTGNGGATLNLINSTVTNNGNGSFGGGIYNSAATGTATLNITNSTIAGNRAASQGGGIYNFGNNGAGTVNLNNSIVADNVAQPGNGPDISNSFGNLSGNNNIIENSGQHTITGSNNSNVDPLLEKDGADTLVLKNNGGPTNTLLPLHTSPAINAGSNAALPADTLDLDGDANTAEPLPVDQRGPGFNRIVNTTVDIGAVEVNYTIAAIAGSPQSALVNTAFAVQLAAQVQESGINQSGLAVTFTAPVSGAGGSFSGSATVNTDASGIAMAPVFTANGTAGGYNVVASLVGGSPSANFSLANLSTISINDVTITEGNAATANLTFTVTLAATSNLTVTVDYATANGSATTADNDYQLTSGTVTFTPGDSTETVTVLVNGDQKTEPDETVFVVLSNPVNAAFSDSQGTGTILNDDDLQLLLDTSGPDANQLAALDSLLLVRDPFRVQNNAPWFTSDQNTRVVLFALNLQLNSGAVVKIMLVDGNGQPHEVDADDVRTISDTSFTQVVFRLPELAQGTCLVSIKAHQRISNTGTFRIVP